MAMLMRRLRAGQFTVHGFRSSFRDWAAETGVVFEVAEASLAHAIGSNVTRSYLRTTMLERRWPIMAGVGELRLRLRRRQRGAVAPGRGG